MRNRAERCYGRRTGSSYRWAGVGVAALVLGLGWGSGRITSPEFVAARAGDALWSFDWSTPSTVSNLSLRPWVTLGLWREIDHSPGAPAATARRIADHEIDRVISMTTVVADRSAGGVGMVVSAQVSVTINGAVAGVGRDDAQMLVVRTERGWRVGAIDF